MEDDKPKKKRTFFDRRSGQDRRDSYNIDYFLEGGTERRNSPASGRREKNKDRRKDWIKISRWSSLYVDSEEDKTDDEEDNSIDIE